MVTGAAIAVEVHHIAASISLLEGENYSPSLHQITFTKMNNLSSSLVILAILFMTSMASCVNPSQVENPPSQVVLIFKDAPLQNSTKKIQITEGSSTTMMNPDEVIGYVDSSGLESYFIPRTIGYDTLVVPTFGGIAEISHLYQVYETIHYLFLVGDTILFTYDNNTKRPYAQSISSPQNTQLYNLAFDNPAFLQPNSYSALTTLGVDKYWRAYWLKKGFYKVLPPASLRAKLAQLYIDLDSLEVVYNSYAQRFSHRIDSMYRINAIPKPFYDYYKRKLMIENEYKLQYRCRRHTLNRDSTTLPDRDEFYRTHIADSLIYQLSYQNFLAWTALPSVYKQPTGRFFNKNIRIVFDSLSTDQRIPKLTKKIILNKYLHVIADNLPADILQVYKDKYAELVGDTLMKAKVVNSPNIVDGYSNDLDLLTLSGEKMSYNELLAKHKGKVIYVDFWASWCAPCLASMPAAAKLRNSFKNKDVNFIYLALNDNVTAWKNAVSKYQTNVDGENFFIENSKDNRFLQELKLHGIPFAIIYDKDLKLQVINAPGPEDSNIRELLDEYLRK